MKLIYILGLEHSGTTLTDHLLSTQPGVIGLGEIASFFSPEHMEKYIGKWGGLSDAFICSCGNEWKRCDFWSHLLETCGLYSAASLSSKYLRLFLYVREKYGENSIIVDSSKSVDTLKLLIGNCLSFGMTQNDIIVVYAIKDVRSFAASIAGKKGATKSLRLTWQTFNYWLSANKAMLNYVTSAGVQVYISLYEALCSSPAELFERLLGSIDNLEASSAESLISNSSSHISMGNKDFIMSNRSRIKYDSRWFTDDIINLAYLLHCRARRFNHYIYKIASLQ